GLAAVPAVLAAAVAGLRRARARTGRLRWTWAGLGAGAAVYALGEADRIVSAVLPGTAVRFPGPPDIGYLGMVVLVATALLIVPVAPQSTAHRVRGLVDLLMIATSALLVSWIFVLGPVLDGDTTGAALWVTVGYQAADVVLVTVVLSMPTLRRRVGPDGRALAVAAGALLAVGFADGLVAHLALAGTGPGPWADLSRFAGFAVVFGAAASGGAISGAATAAVSAGTGDEAANGAGQARLRPGLLTPYAAVLAALLAGLVWHDDGGRTDAFFAACRSALIALIVARQLLTLLENRYLTANLEDRVARRTAELYASEQRFRALVLQSSESVAVLEADSTVRFQSDSIERIFGWPARALIGRRLIDMVDGPARARIEAALASVRDRPQASAVVEVTLPHADGRRRQAEMTMTNLLHDPSVGGIVFNTRDVHDAKELQEQLVHEAYHDGLTGLASRALFAERLEAAMAAAGQGDGVAVLFLDLDGFKEVNDSLGHVAGDQLLVRVAGRLLESVREDDTVARFGGDEFGVLVQSVTAHADAEAVARRIVAALREPFTVGGRELHVGTSIGIASDADAGDAGQLLRNADLAMYEAKSGGGNRVAGYRPQMHDALVGRLELEADLRAALGRGELVLHYQPTVSLSTGEITGFEALVRWRHPVRGMVSPFEFIGIAEATGLIVPLGRWVLEEACRQAVAWGAGTTRRLKMAVNVSVRQFDHGDLAAQVAEVLADTGMPAGHLCLEMTESVLLTDTEENIARLRRLKELGVVLAMDDFGTGYSSLAYLRRFPMDTLKIDRSFVDRLGGDSEDVALVRTIVRLGQSLGMSTVAEGVENQTQLELLSEMGCDVAQGYLLSRPVPASEAARLLETGVPGRPSGAPVLPV
ncbi:putative bifunctional diguanylate cyclase/phosphodiesterase, partial [Mangrovihabitans endophyticus]|uniref:putative bifunctional diguanylate cyclase/phosphodiesterase n=1 Tax=Mangrovihabitans endophyticus TaxID=1751298 RepID=UPI00166AA301